MTIINSRTILRKVRLRNIRLRKISTALVVFITISAAAARAAESVDRVEVSALGPQVGERVPDFRLADQLGEVHTLDSIMGPNGAMLLFHRSADW